MYKVRGRQEKQVEMLAGITELEPSAIHIVLLERAKHAALAIAVALLERGAEALCSKRYECK